MNFIFYDLETTGRNSTWDQIIQVAAILVDKDFNEIEKKIVYEPVKLQQDYRHFDIQSPWEGTTYKEEEQDGNGGK